MVILTANNICKIYNSTFIDQIHHEKKNYVLKGINIRVEKNECISIMGRSGCGKNNLIIIIVTHDPVVASYAKKIYFIKDGLIVGELENDYDNEKSREKVLNMMFQL